MQGTARGRCFRFPHESPNEHLPYRMANESQDARPAQGPKRMQGTARGRCFRFPYENPNEHSPFSYVSQDKRIAQHKTPIPAIGNAAQLLLHTNVEL